MTSRSTKTEPRAAPASHHVGNDDPRSDMPEAPRPRDRPPSSGGGRGPPGNRRVDRRPFRRGPGGRPRAGLFLLKRLEEEAQQMGIVAHVPPYSAYQNTIPLERQGAYPGDLAIEERITSSSAGMRWRWSRANRAHGELGGHIASYASSAEIFEVGFNHFFRGPGEDRPGDLVFFQPHSSPASTPAPTWRGGLPRSISPITARSRWQRVVLLSAPWLMPDFWQFSTGSMGIGPITSIYQARFMRYCAPRESLTPRDRHVWGVFGDGEMDEPESIGALTLAAREELDNLTFIINCNLQRLDGPVRGNGQIIQEFDRLFPGPAGTSSRSCGARTGTRCSPATSTTRCCAASPQRSTASTRPWAQTTAPTTWPTFSIRTRNCGALVAHMPRRDRRPYPRRSRSQETVRSPARRQGARGAAHRHPGQDQEGLRYGGAGE